MAEVMRCYRHPKRETRVSCATCGRPICTECMRPTDVGIKCPDDARLPRGARTGVMKTGQIARSLLGGAGIALAGLPIVAVLYRLPFTWLLALALGYGAGTLVNRAGGRNGGPLAVTISIIAVVIPFLVMRLVPDIVGGANPERLIFDFVPMALAAVTAGLANRQL